MARYIDADKFEQEQAYLRAHLTFPDGTESLGYCAVLTSVQIKDAPTEDVAPVVHAHWCVTDAYPHNVYCSKCLIIFAQTHWPVWEDNSLPRTYCPGCGAKMDEVQDG